MERLGCTWGRRRKNELKVLEGVEVPEVAPVGRRAGRPLGVHVLREFEGLREAERQVPRDGCIRDAGEYRVLVLEGLTDYELNRGAERLRDGSRAVGRQYCFGFRDP